MTTLSFMDVYSFAAIRPLRRKKREDPSMPGAREGRVPVLRPGGVEPRAHDDVAPRGVPRGEVRDRAGRRARAVPCHASVGPLCSEFHALRMPPGEPTSAEGNRFMR